MVFLLLACFTMKGKSNTKTLWTFDTAFFIVMKPSASIGPDFSLCVMIENQDYWITFLKQLGKFFRRVIKHPYQPTMLELNLWRVAHAIQHSLYTWHAFCIWLLTTVMAHSVFIQWTQKYLLAEFNSLKWIPLLLWCLHSAKHNINSRFF